MSDPSGGATFLEFGWLSISVPNLIMFSIMVLLFVLAILLPFPSGGPDVTEDE